VLESEVLSGALAPGTRLSEESIAATFKVSRSPAREALVELERAGLATRAGAFDRMIRVPTREFIAERYDLWWIIDIGRTYLASLSATAGDIAELRSYLDRAARALKARDSRRYRAATDKFHEKMRQGCSKSFVNAIGTNCSLLLRWFETIYDQSPDMSEAAVTEHRQILDAYARKDLGGLAESIYKHTERQRDRILNSIPEDKPIDR
jgi:DNA-binding GntR family transcriptional regulator